MQEKPTIEKLSIIPRKGDKNVGRQLFIALEAVLRDKEALGLKQRWTRNAELVRNKFWKSKSSVVPLVTTNLLYTHVIRNTNQLTDNNPTFNVIPAGETGEDETRFDMIHETVDFWWQETEQQSIFSDSVWNGETTGTAIEKSVFNPSLNDGQGECETITVDPFNFGVYPTHMRDNQKAYINFHYIAMPLREVQAKWGKAAENVVADEAILKELGDDRREIQAGRPDLSKGYMGSIGGLVKNILGDNREAQDDMEKKVLVVEAWIRDGSVSVSESIIESENVAGEIRNKKKREEKPLYKGGIRRVIACNLGKVILEDKDNPSINPELPDEEARKTYLWDHVPFATAQSVKNPFALWGADDFEQLSPIQSEINKTVSQITYFKDKSVRSKLVNPGSSGVKNSELNNLVGIINPTNSLEASGIRWLEPPQINADLYRALETYKALFFLVSGAFELDQAQLPGNEVIAYKAITALLERSSAINRHKERSYTRLIRERGRMAVSNMQNWYTEDRFIAVQKGGKPKPLKINAKHLRVPINLMVVSGSTMPVSTVQMREEAITLYKMGLIDREEALKRLDWPDYMEIVARMNAGPLALAFQNLGALGIPTPLLQIMQQIASAKPEDIAKEAKAGKLPNFMEIMKQVLSGGQPEMSPEQQLSLQKIQAETMETQAKGQKTLTDAEKVKADIAKAQADIQLTYEQIKTEMVRQQVMAEGVKLDWKKIELEAAKIVNDLESKSTPLPDSTGKTVQGPFIERGMVSDNVEQL